MLWQSPLRRVWGCSLTCTSPPEEKDHNRENYPKTSKFFCMTQKPSDVCKKSYSQGKTLLRKLKFVIPFFKNNSTWKLWAKFINKDYPTGWVWQTLANTYNKLSILSKQFCIENMISCTQQMVFVSYKRICLLWDNFHDYYFFNPLYLSIFVKDFYSHFWQAVFAIWLKTYIVICSQARDVKIGIFYDPLKCHL